LKITEYFSGSQELHEASHIPLTGVILLILLCLLWGGNMVSIKISNQGVPPILAATIRSIVASVLLWIFASIQGQRVFLDSGDLKHGAAIGLMFGVEFLLLYYGTDFTNISRAIIFLYTQPFWTAVMAHFFLARERLTALKTAGLLSSFMGLVVVFGSPSTTLGPHYWAGDLMEVGAGVLWAATSVYIKRFMLHKPISPYQTLFAQLFFSIPVLTIGYLFIEWGRPIGLNTVVIAALFHQSVIVAFMSYLVWFWMIHRYQVSRLAAFTFLTPLFGVLLSGIILKEALTVILLIGLALVAAGLYLVNRPET